MTDHVYPAVLLLISEVIVLSGHREVMLSDGGDSNARCNHHWESAAAKNQQYASDHASRPSLQAVVRPRVERLDTRKVHFSDERHTDNVTGHQYQQHHHSSYTSPGITRDSRQLGNAEAEKPLSAGCTWNVSGKAGVHNTDSYDVISTLASGNVELSDQKPRCNVTKPKHEVTFARVSNTMLLSFSLCLKRENSSPSHLCCVLYCSKIPEMSRKWENMLSEKNR